MTKFSHCLLTVEKSKAWCQMNISYKRIYLTRSYRSNIYFERFSLQAFLLKALSRMVAWYFLNILRSCGVYSNRPRAIVNEIQLNRSFNSVLGLVRIYTILSSIFVNRKITRSII
ncbi:unnamed protein product [Albugo candida]|uniref:Uncharacterized protein n=1 Tax=Albugo candida TaxID=65357 RepID=A0A024GRK1_9STRA|nr:unnamed protein product [Albugo candida]|eukprot:CCI49529.1 unnamed protein product [Albugo candida]